MSKIIQGIARVAAFAVAGFWSVTAVLADGEPVAYNGQTEVGSYLISARTQLETLRDRINQWNKYEGSVFTLTTDIDLGDSNWVPANCEFWGTFDGDGHTISNLVVAMPSDTDVGLFRYLKNATVKRLSLRGGRITGMNRTGGIVGRICGGTTLEDCTVDLEIVGNGMEAGGLVGWIDGSGGNSITRCRMLGPVTTYAREDRAGGLVGVYDSDFQISGCYVSGLVCGHGTAGHVGDFAGKRNNGTLTIDGSYSAATLESCCPTNCIVGSGLANVFVTNPVEVLDGFPKNRVNLAKRGNGAGTVAWNGGTPVAAPDAGSFFVCWEGEPTVSPDSNERTVYAVFGQTISTTNELFALSDKGYFKLTADLDLGGAAWMPKALFQGLFDGDGHAIENFVIDRPQSEMTGFFGSLMGATIRNLTLRKGRVEGSRYVGGLAGYSRGGTTLENCTVDLEVVGNSYDVGGLVGLLDSDGGNRIWRCRSLGPITSYGLEDRAGGLIGEVGCGLSLEECYAAGFVTGRGNAGLVGGLVGNRSRGTLTVSNCYSAAELQGNYITNGIVGSGLADVVVQGSPTVLDCFPKNIRNLSKRGNGSGTVAWNGDKPVATLDAGSCLFRWEGLPPSSGDYNERTVYAVFGRTVSTEQELRELPAKGFFRQTVDITMGSAPFKGLHSDSQRFQGDYDGAGCSIRGLNILTANDQGAYEDRSGLFRVTQGAILRNLRLTGGKVTGNGNVGALIGQQIAGLVENCLSAVGVYGSDGRVGGLVGSAEWSVVIRKCAAAGPVMSNGSDAGGLVGYLYGGSSSLRPILVENCYARGDVSADGSCGGFAGSWGSGAAVISNCYSSGNVRCYDNASGFIRNAPSGGGQCFWDLSKAGQPSAGFGTGLATEDMFGSTAYEGWSDDVWEFHANGYPTLKGMPSSEPVPLVAGSGSGTVAASDNHDGTWTLTATPDADSYFIRWSGISRDDAASPTVQVALDGTEAPTAQFGRSIRNAADLRAFRAKPHQYGNDAYKLDADIDLGGNDGAGESLMADIFRGSFDGQGHTISNFVLRAASSNNVGFFTEIRSGEVRDFSLRGGVVEGHCWVGGLAGIWRGRGSIADITTDLEVIADCENVGGLVGWVSGIPKTMVRCRALGSVEGYGIYIWIAYGGVSGVGGLVGQSDCNLTLDSCYTSGSVTGIGTTPNVGGLVGNIEFNGETVTFSNCYSNARIQGGRGDFLFGTGDGNATIVGRPEVLDCFPKNIVNLKAGGNGTGTVARVGGSFAATPAEGSFFVRMDGEPPEAGEFNECTVRAIFGQLVATSNDFIRLPTRGYFAQTADFDLGSRTEAPFSSASFQGEYDGRGHEIYLDMTNATTYGACRGLFGSIKGATVRNIQLKGGWVSGKDTLGGFVGKMESGLIENCSTDLKVVGNNDSYDVGGFVGKVYGSAVIRNCAARGKVIGGRGKTGGFVGQCDQSGQFVLFENCYSSGDVSSTGNGIGGFVAGCYGEKIYFSRCYSSGQVTPGAAGGNTGAFAGLDMQRCRFRDCFWDAGTAGVSTSVVGTAGLSTAAMKTAATFAGWDEGVWKLVDGRYPELYAETLPGGTWSVTWLDEDGTVLAEEREAVAGCVPVYRGKVPRKAPADGALYSFDGWSPAPTRLAGDTVCRATYRASYERTWMDLDLRTGEIRYYDFDFDTATNRFNTEEYKTEKMAFRRVEAGDDYFVQGGRYTAQFTNSYYIALFETTTAQYSLMNDRTCPAFGAVELRTQCELDRGIVRGDARAPAAFGEGFREGSPFMIFKRFMKAVTGDSRMVFDLPTEAMWEVAARAADSGDASHADWPWFFGSDPADLAAYGFVGCDETPDDYGNGVVNYGSNLGRRVPGCRLPNPWGLYDVYGNAAEICLDDANGIDNPVRGQGEWTLAPLAGGTGNQRVRGGSFASDATPDGTNSCSSVYRNNRGAGFYGSRWDTGIRLARICTAEEEKTPAVAYTITWKDDDGTVLATDTIAEGKPVRFKGTLPAKFDAAGTCLFKHWSPEVIPTATADAVYTAVYQLSPLEFLDLDWFIDGGEISGGAVCSPSLPNSSSTSARMTVQGPGTLSFGWRANLSNYDEVWLYTNDVRACGFDWRDSAWTSIVCRVEGDQVVSFRWTATKGYWSGADVHLWLKDIVWTPDPDSGIYVPESVTGDTGFAIPQSWFDRYPGLTAKFGSEIDQTVLKPSGKTAPDGSPMYVWQDFVAGTDPTDPGDIFRMTIEMDGATPLVSWEPNLNTEGHEGDRLYRILARRDLADPNERWSEELGGARFFKVQVSMPKAGVTSAEPGPLDVTDHLISHLSFDDYGNGGLNVLKAERGEDAVVRTNSANVVSGLGEVTCVTDPDILAGLEPGDGAVAIPKYTHLALPIPEALTDVSGHPYTIKMKVKFPSFGPFYTLLNMPADNLSDVMVYLSNSSNPVLRMQLNSRVDGVGGFTAGQWETIVLQFGETTTKAFLNGVEIFSYDCSLADRRANCFNAGGYFLISADNDGDDNLMYWADVKVYDGIVAP